MDDVRYEVDGACGIVTLNRPAALNALTTPMIRSMTDALSAWHADARIASVILKSASPKAFCAGGDIKAVRASSIAGDGAANEAFFSTEYVLDELIATYAKPFVSLIDGICMGGGMGISVHGRFRVVTERALFAMPEVGIGFFPDVGASYFLPRLPGQVGTYLGLTGARAGGGDAVYARLGTHFVPSARLAELERALRSDRQGAIGATLERWAESPPEAPLAAHRETLDRVFAGATAADIVDALERADDPWSRESLGLLRRGSPLSLAITCALVRRGARVPLHACFEQELRLGRVVTRSPDFLEGVRAVLVDKDGRPRWTHAAVRDVRAGDLAGALAALEG